LSSENPGKAARRGDIVGKTKRRPPQRHPGIFQKMGMNCVKNTVASQPGDDYPRSRFESDDDRDRIPSASRTRPRRASVNPIAYGIAMIGKRRQLFHDFTTRAGERPARVAAPGAP